MRSIEANRDYIEEKVSALFQSLADRGYISNFSSEYKNSPDNLSGLYFNYEQVKPIKERREMSIKEKNYDGFSEEVVFERLMHELNTNFGIMWLFYESEEFRACVNSGTLGSNATDSPSLSSPTMSHRLMTSLSYTTSLTDTKSPDSLSVTASQNITCTLPTLTATNSLFPTGNARNPRSWSTLWHEDEICGVKNARLFWDPEHALFDGRRFKSLQQNLSPTSTQTETASERAPADTHYGAATNQLFGLIFRSAPDLKMFLLRPLTFQDGFLPEISIYSRFGIFKAPVVITPEEYGTFSGAKRSMSLSR